MDGDTVWLMQEQMSSLFDTSRSSIAYHIGNIFKEGELEKNTSVEIFDRSSYDSDVRFTVSAVRIDEHEWKNR